MIQGFHTYSMARFVERIGHQQFFETFSAALGSLPITWTVNGPWLCGGAVRDVIAGRETDTDWDLFFADKDQFDVVVNAMLKAGFVKERETPTNITFRKHEMVVQAIRITWYASIEEVLDSFDFTICQFGVVPWNGSLVVGEYSLFDLARKRLALHRLTYGVSTLRRLMKYSRKGFTVCSGVLADILARTINDPGVVNPQIVSLD